MKLTTRQSKSGTVFSLDYYLNGERIRETLKGIRSRKDAEAIAALRAADLAKQRLVGDDVAVQTSASKMLLLSDLLKADAAREGVAPSTVKREREGHAAILKHWGNDIRVGAITQQDVDRLIDERRKDGCSNAGINKELGFLRAALNRALKNKIITRLPVKVTLLKESAPKTRALSREETARLLAVAQAHDPEMFDRLTVMLALALRPAELWRMRWKDIDLSTATATVVNHKGRGQRVHHLPINDDALAVLKLRFGRGQSREALVFGTEPDARSAARAYKRKGAPGAVGGVVVFSDHNFHRKLNRLKTLAKIEGDVMPYTMRHTAGTRLAETTSIHVAAVMMKHVDLKMMTRYAHPSHELMRKAAQSLVINSAEPVEAKGLAENTGQKLVKSQKRNGQNVSASKGKR